MSGFLDHFAGSGLDARWTPITSGAGSVAVADSLVDIHRPGATDQAYIYTQLDRTKDWALDIACGSFLSGFRVPAYIVDTSTPGSLNSSNVNARTCFRLMDFYTSGSLRMKHEYNDTGGTRRFWNDQTHAWVTSNPTGNALAGDNEFHVVRVQNHANGGSPRLRMGFLTQSDAGSYSFDQGLRLHSLTDWVSWSSVQHSPQSDLYLVLGFAYDAAIPSRTKVEYVVYRESSYGSAWLNGRDSTSDVYDIRKQVGMEDLFLPVDRNTVAVGPGHPVKDPSVIEDAGTYHMLVAHETPSGQWNIRRHSAAVPADPFSNESWTDHGVVIARGSEGEVFFPCLRKDPAESDASRIWKLLYAAYNGSDFTVEYAVAPTDCAGGPGSFFKQGTIISPGAAGSWNEHGSNNPVFLWSDGQWEAWYSGLSGGFWRMGRASGSDLASLTPDPSNPIITWSTDGEANLTQAIAGVTAVVDSTAGFVADQIVCFTHDTVPENYSLSRIRKVVSSTELELYHPLSFPSGTVVQSGRAHGLYVRTIRALSGEWVFDGVVFRYFRHIAGRDAFDETSARWRHSGALPGSATPALAGLGNPIFPQTAFGHARSCENVAYPEKEIVR